MDNLAYSRLLKKVKSPLPMKGIERRVFCSVFFLVVAGVSLSYSLNDCEWLERAGSLIVVIGIYWVWKDTVSLVGGIRNMYSEIQGHVKNFDEQAIWAVKNPGIITNEMVRNKDRCKVESYRVYKVFDALKQRCRFLEAITMILGTVVWGFGSLFSMIL